MSDIYFIVIPVVIVVVILKLCLIFWRIWLYQKRRERVYLIQNQRRPQRAPQQQPGGPATARVIGVERSLGPDGFTQRTSYLVNQPGLPARQITRTIVIRPNDNRRPNDPNLPPSYDHAVTGRDKSVKVEGYGNDDVGPNPAPLATDQASAPPPPPPPQPSAPPPPMPPPHVTLAPPTDISGIPPPEYSARRSSIPSDESDVTDENRHLLA